MGPPPAWHLAREALAVIIRFAGQAPSRFRPLSSNVRPHSHQPRVIVSSSSRITYPLLTFDGSVEHSSDVAAWFESKPHELQAIARHWFARLRASGPEVMELLHDGCPVACVQDAPFGYVNAFRAHVNVGFFHGASLADPLHVLEGTGRYMRHAKLRPGKAYNAAALEALIVAAYEDILLRLGHSSGSGPVA